MNQEKYEYSYYWIPSALMMFKYGIFTMLPGSRTAQKLARECNKSPQRLLRYGEESSEIISLTVPSTYIILIHVPKFFPQQNLLGASWCRLAFLKHFLGCSFKRWPCLIPDLASLHKWAFDLVYDTRSNTGKRGSSIPAQHNINADKQS